MTIEIDDLPLAAAVVDRAGEVVEANAAWRTAADLVGPELATLADDAIRAQGPVERDVADPDRRRVVRVRARATAVGVLVVAHDATDEYDLRARARASMLDPLTGLANRASLDRELADLGTDEVPGLAVLFCDVDDFKAINDTHGHAVGDAVLRAIGGRLRAGVRDRDTAARYGGDEFVVLLRDTDELRANAIARRIAREIREPVAAGGVVVTPSASVGLATGRPGDDPQSLVDRADAAMYTAKRRSDEASAPAAVVHDRASA